MITSQAPRSILKIAQEERERMKKSRKKRAFIYVRYSDESEKLDSQTMLSQEMECSRYCEAQGYEIVGIFKEAKSATKRSYKQRPEMKNTMNASALGQADVVVVSEFSRLARKSEEQRFLRSYFELHLNVKVESATQSNDKGKLSGVMDEVTAVISEEEAASIKTRTMRGKMDRLRNGNLGGGGHPHYGYRFVDTSAETNARYEHNTEPFICLLKDCTEWSQYDVVLWVWNRADNADNAEKEAWTGNRISVELNKMGIPTMLGNLWQRNQVVRILSQEAYIGRAVVNKWTRDEDDKIRRRPKEEHIFLPEGVIPPIIVTEDGRPDVDRFERMQTRLALNKLDSDRNCKEIERPRLLVGGFARCAVCGKVMKPRYNPNGYPRKDRKTLFRHAPEYQCNVNNGGDGIENRHCVNISMRALDRAAWEYVKPFLRDPYSVREHIDALRGKIDKMDNRKLAEQQIKDYEEAISRYLKLIGLPSTDDKTANEITSLIDRYSRQKEEAEKMLANERADEEFNTQINHILDKFMMETDEYRPFLDDPDHEFDHKQMRKVIRMFGVVATIGPASKEVREQADIKVRKMFELIPPDIWEILEYTS